MWVVQHNTNFITIYFHVVSKTKNKQKKLGRVGMKIDKYFLMPNPQWRFYQGEQKKRNNKKSANKAEHHNSHPQLITRTTHSVLSRSTVLNPGQVHVAERLTRDAWQSVVVVLIYVAAEGRVKVNVAVLRCSVKGLSDTGIINPLLKTRRPHRVVNDALRWNASHLPFTLFKVNLHKIPGQTLPPTSPCTHTQIKGRCTYSCLYKHSVI